MAKFRVVIVIAKKHFLLVLISCCLSSGNGENTAILKNTETSTGATVTLHCRSPISSIEWHHLPLGSQGHEIVYQDGFIFNGYKERFSVNRKDNGEYHLVIKNVKTTDAGKYTCVEKSEVPLQNSAQLIVFEQYPSNKFCLGKYTCTPTCDALELTCSIKSYGKIIPSMEWRESTKGILTSNSDNNNGTTVSAIRVDLQQGSSNTQSYTCRVKYPLHSSLTSQFSWSFLASALASQAPSSSNEKLQVRPSTTGSIVGIALLLAVVVAMAVVIVKQFLRNKRITAELQNSRKPSQSEGAKSNDVEMKYVSENKHLLTPEDKDDDSIGFVPRTPLNKNKSIFGIGVLDDEIFLVTRDGCVVEVFELENANFKRAWMIDGVVNPCGMAVCSIKSLVFFCDWKKTGRRSEIIGCDKDGHVSCRWTSENERGRISITKETNIIVAENFFNSINEYEYVGKNVSKLRVGKEKFHLDHALKLENGNFVASFGDTQDDIREICVIDNQGKTLYSFNQDSYHLQYGARLSSPRTLAVDNEGTIYVCDLYNCRIILMTSELQYTGCIDKGDSDEKLRGPLRICIHESHNKRQLMVADSVKKDGEWIDGRILVLNIAPI